ncbi:MAG: ribulose-phosphate 3-epimerase [Thermoplasmatales archaeon]|nr:ribulose-phosphate 3-epimerase [Thermoplasmatales archaeon]
MINKTIIPAIIAKSQEELDELLSKVTDIVEIAQLDVMDEKFVPNTSLFFDFRLPKTSCLFEAHLMIEDPETWIKDNWQKVDTILVHYESCNDPKSIISNVKNKGKKVGFVLNPETPIQNLSDFIDDINQVLIMTVNPGFYGSPFLPEMLDKITELRNMKPDLDIEVDGGVTDKTISLVDKAGANMFVSGSYIMKAKNVEDSINSLKTLIE